MVLVVQHDTLGRGDGARLVAANHILGDAGVAADVAVLAALARHLAPVLVGHDNVELPDDAPVGGDEEAGPGQVRGGTAPAQLVKETPSSVPSTSRKKSCNWSMQRDV